MAVMAVVAVVCGPLMLIILGNAGSGVAEYVSSKTPLAKELPGSYSYRAEWGDAILTLASNQTFTEFIQSKAGSVQWLQGRWSSAFMEEPPVVTFSDFLSVQDDDYGQRQGSFGMQVLQSRFSGRISLNINDDLGQQFEKTQ